MYQVIAYVDDTVVLVEHCLDLLEADAYAENLRRQSRFDLIVVQNQVNLDDEL